MSDFKGISEFKSLLHMLTCLPTKEACREHYENVMWGGVPVCPHCAGEKAYKLKVKGEFKGLYKCGDCRRRYTVTVGTTFEGSHVKLRTWYIGFYLFIAHKHGISTRTFASDLGVTQATAWYMLKRIRHACGQEIQEGEQLDALASMDETFVGGKNKNRHKDKKVPKSQGRAHIDKTPVFGLMQNGKIFTKVILDTSRKSLRPLVKSLVKEGSTIVTDEWGGYNGLEKDYDRQIVNHRTKEYKNEAGYSTNNVENFWSHLKRGINGNYYKVSRKHLQLYCNEFSYRFNTRKLSNSEKFITTLRSSQKGRLRYKDLINSKPLVH